MAGSTTPARLRRLLLSRNGRLTALITLPLIALLTRNGWVAALIILAGYGVGLVAVWLWQGLLTVPDLVRGWATRRRRLEYLVPRELPTSPPFVGRTRELATLHQTLDNRSDPPRLVVIHGPAGIGKSALALHFAQRVTERFEDGQLFASLRRHDPEPSAFPAGLAELLKDFIMSIQAAHDPPPVGDLPELRGRYEQLTRSRRLLVVLDDVPSAEPVRALLPAGRGCLTVVTSPTPLDQLNPTAQVRLGPLSQTEGLDMFQAIIGSRRISTPEETSHAQHIVRQSRCHPSALQLVGGMVSTRPAWSLAPVARLLDRPYRTGPGLAEGTPLDDALDLIYALLTEDERRAARMIGALEESEPLAPWKLAALLNDDEPAARRVVDRLVHAGLVGRVDSETVGVTEYRVHDHIHSYARRLASETGELAALRAQLRSARSDRAAARQFEAVQQQVQKLQDAGRPAEATIVAREAVAWALDQGVLGVRAVAQATLAELHIELGNLEAAEDLARAASEAAEKAREPLPRAQAMRALGRLLRRLGQPGPAVAYHTAALAEAESAGRAGIDVRPERVRLLRHRAAAYADSRRPEDGLRDLDEADRLDQSAAAVPGYTSMRAGLLWARGTVVAAQDRPAEAVELLAAAVAAAATHEQPLWWAWSMLDLARIRVRSGHPQQALTDARHALEAFAGMSHRYGKAKCRLVIAQALARSPESTGVDRDPRTVAAAELESALETFRNCGDRWIDAQTATELADIRRQQGRTDEAAALLRSAILGFSTAGDQARADEVRRQLRHRSSRRRSARRDDPASGSRPRRLGS